MKAAILISAFPGKEQAARKCVVQLLEDPRVSCATQYVGIYDAILHCECSDDSGINDINVKLRDSQAMHTVMMIEVDHTAGAAHRTEVGA